MFFPLKAIQFKGMPDDMLPKRLTLKLFSPKNKSNTLYFQTLTNTTYYFYKGLRKIFNY